ncbi:MAG: sensor signal transduction histidine kinase [Verrucomicrobiales bacterium]|nr:sensor signal transduction histidine kinase [Verrucomicrobiales bacterium]
MSFLSASTIKRKLMVIIMITCSVALVLACAAILIFEITSFRKTLLRNTAVMADVIGANSTTALLYNDRDAAKESLASLKAEPYVLAACLYDTNGVVFATYRNDKAKEFDPPRVAAEDFTFNKDALNLFHKIRFDGDTVGTVFIRADLRVIRERLQTYLGIVACVVASATMVTFLLSLRLQKLISGPISHLAETANKVANQKNYSIRATKNSSDEMGQLIERFNEMLSGIQERDAALLTAHTELEKRVDERTKELQLEISERSRVEAALRISQQKFENLVNSIDGVVWESDPKFQFTFVSPQAERLLDYPREDWTAKKDFWNEHLHPDDNLLAHDLRHKALTQDKASHFEYRMVAADGRVVWIREISSFIFDKGQAQALRGVLFDITEQKQAEEQLDMLNKRLLETSRHAGMAEVATGVLHNVGNVLNSVNVSSTLICDQVRNSKASRLKDVVLLLNKNATNLGHFIVEDPKGKIIPGYLNSLSERLSTEQQDLLKELELLTKNIEHIKEIVAMQQNYARVSGIIESLAIKNLVEDALQMHAGALSRHGILVSRDYSEVPMIAVDKHKILQILVNLIRNAKYAIDSAARRDKRLHICIGMNARNMVEISVKDNGIGIAQDNLTRIFSHGFTTKRDGHGFGLHSGALAAKEMGGSLSAQSEGAGQGATFVLELPLSAPKGLDRNGGKA